jgi:hypothetical protein
MSDSKNPAGVHDPAAPRFPLLEKITAVVLVLVVLSLGWMVMVANAPSLARLPSAEMEVLIVLALLLAALILVSLVALLHTRS